MAIKLVAVDLDDTLLDHTNMIAPETRAVIIDAIKKGVTVTLATGRMYRSALPFARQLGLDVPIITYNGAMIKSCLSEELIYTRPLELAVANDILNLCRDNDWYVQAYIDDNLYVREVNEKARAYEQMAGVKAVPVGNDLFNLKADPLKLLIVAEMEEKKQICRYLKDRFGIKAHITNSKATYLEITNPTAKKSLALEYLAGWLGVNQSEVMAVGDSGNDLDMIEYAGWGVAMGNAAEEVKAVAQAVTLRNDEQGVAEAIRRYVLDKL